MADTKGGVVSYMKVASKQDGIAGSLGSPQVYSAVCSATDSEKPRRRTTMDVGKPEEHHARSAEIANWV